MSEMNKLSSFKPGDKVFAKLKGYPPWPAVVVDKIMKKIQVKFYGTNDTGFVKPEDIYPYLQYKDQYLNASKKKEFKIALEQIEQELQPNDRGTENTAKKRKPESAASFDHTCAKKKLVVLIKDDIRKPLSNSAEYIISERNLQNWIAYGEIVSKRPVFYSNLPTYPRNCAPNPVFPIILPNGAIIALKVHESCPIPTFSNEFTAALYDSQRAAILLSQKETFVKGENRAYSDLIAQNVALTVEEIKERVEQAGLVSSRRKTARLKLEVRLLRLGMKIKATLAEGKGEVSKVVACLDEMLEIPMDEVMLKKHADVEALARLLRIYEGNARKARRLRLKAGELYRKIQSVFKRYQFEDDQFKKGFDNLVEDFNKECAILRYAPHEIHYLIDEPYSRQAIFDRFDDAQKLEEEEDKVC